MKKAKYYKTLAAARLKIMQTQASGIRSLKVKICDMQAELDQYSPDRPVMKWHMEGDPIYGLIYPPCEVPTGLRYHHVA